MLGNITLSIAYILFILSGLSYCWDRTLTYGTDQSPKWTYGFLPTLSSSVIVLELLIQLYYNFIFKDKLIYTEFINLVWAGIIFVGWVSCVVYIVNWYERWIYKCNHDTTTDVENTFLIQTISKSGHYYVLANMFLFVTVVIRL